MIGYHFSKILKSLAIILLACTLGAQEGFARSAGRGDLDALESNATLAFLLPVGGCKFIDAHSSAAGSNIIYLTSEMRWSGGCGANGLANGKGVLRICYKAYGNEGCSEFEGTINNGIMQGRAFSRNYQRDRSSGAMVASKYSPDSWVEFDNGCYRGGGEQGCDSSAPLQLQSRYIAGGGNPASGGSGTAPGDVALCAVDRLQGMNQEIAGLDDRLASFLKSVPDSAAGATGMLRVTMWALKSQADAIRKYCPVGESSKLRIAELETSFKSAQTACDQIQAGGGRCAPMEPEALQASISKAKASASSAQATPATPSSRADRPSPATPSSTRECGKICTAN